MKKGIILAFTALTLALGTVSCSKSDDNKGGEAPNYSQLILAKWKTSKTISLDKNNKELFIDEEKFTDCTKDDYTEYLSTGVLIDSYSELIDGKCTLIVPEGATWKLVGNQLTESYKGSEPDTYTIISITDKELVYEYPVEPHTGPGASEIQKNTVKERVVFIKK